MALSALPPTARLPPGEVSPPIAPKSGQKRTVGGAVLLEPQPQQRRRRLVSPTPESSAPSWLNFSPTRPIRPPEPSSINNIIREHSRSRLYVSPLHWTSQHLQLLDCQFVLEKAVQQNERSGPEQRRRPGNANHGCCAGGKGTAGQHQYGETPNLPTEAAIRAAADHLLNARTSAFKTLAIQDLLEDDGICQHASVDLSFCFDQHVTVTLQTDGTFSCSSSRSTAPNLAYLDLEAVGSRRDNSVKIPSCNRVNPPIASLRQKRQRRLRPTNEMEDPYIATVLIALAQQRRCQRDASATEHVTMPEMPATYALPERSRSTSRPFSEATKETLTHYKVHLLALPTIDTRNLYFYTAHIPSAFLDRLDRPSRYIPSSPVLISYYRIPLTSPAKSIRAMRTLQIAHQDKDKRNNGTVEWIDKWQRISFCAATSTGNFGIRSSAASQDGTTSGRY
ncbi:hypothetical protein FDECE_11215 [Fusarium decemcellulare]|nr:hypothetical protein FDECE_11215 [Fusarium decemcellulare]